MPFNTAYNGTELARELDKIGLKLRDEKVFNNIVEQAVQKSKATETIKKQVLELVRKNQGQMQREITRSLMGTPTSKAGKAMESQIRSISTYTTSSARRAKRFVDKNYAGSWYRYKAVLAGKRIKRNKHGIHKVAGARLFGRKPTDAESKSLRKLVENPDHSKAAAASLLDKITSEKRFGYIDTDLRFKTDKASRRKPGVIAAPSNRRRPNFDTLDAVKSELREKRTEHPHATARAILAARDLERRGHSKVAYSARPKSERGKQYNMKYVSTGLLAEQLGKSYRVVDVTYKNQNKSKSQFIFTMQYKLDVSRIRFDIKEAWRYSKPLYKHYVVQGTHAIAEEYLHKVLESKYGRSKR